MRRRWLWPRLRDALEGGGRGTGYGCRGGSNRLVPVVRAGHGKPALTYSTGIGRLPPPFRAFQLRVTAARSATGYSYCRAVVLDVSRVKPWHDRANGVIGSR